MKTVKVFITPDGKTLRSIYSDSFTISSLCSETHTTRASHVEPTANGKWEADMSPAVDLLNLPATGEVKLGPFSKRQEALDAEVEWLKERLRSA